jgi:tetratricopeptide (TPR) repeat protein
MKRLTFDDLPDDVRKSLQLMHIPGQDASLCIKSLRQITAAYPGYVPARLNLAAMQLNGGDAESAEKTYQAVLSDFPKENGAVAGLATVFAAKNDYSRAERLARQAIENGYQWAPCYTVIAKCREAAGDIRGASDAYLQSYRMSPHSWHDLQHYCRLNKRAYISPMNEVPQPTTDEQLKDLFAYIDKAANTPDTDGKIAGCDHTLRLSTRWAENHGVDAINLYQFLNAHGGFCDCEVCYNVEPALLANHHEEQADA